MGCCPRSLLDSGRLLLARYRIATATGELVPIVALGFLLRLSTGNFSDGGGKFGANIGKHSRGLSGRHLIIVYTIAGLLSGLAGVVFTAARASTGQAGMGLGYELDAIAATVIGGTSLTGGIGRIWGTVIGMGILGIMTSGFTFLGVDVYYQDIVQPMA